MISDKKKLHQVKKEFQQLKKELDSKDLEKETLGKYYKSLMQINKKLWVIEDEIRKYEAKKIFNEKFIELARDVYFTNDERFEIKNLINTYFGSDISEQKQYEDYK